MSQRSGVLARGISPLIQAALLSAVYAVASADVDDGMTAPLPPQPSSSTDVYAIGQWSYDNNIYRLPSSITNLSDFVGPNASREDHIYSAGLGVDEHWIYGLQSLDVDAQVSHNWFLSNGDLDNTQITANAIDNWQIGPLATGEIGEIFSRSLSNFANTGVYVRDLVDSSEPFATGRFHIAPRWTLIGAVRYRDITHSSSELEIDDFQASSGNAGIEYALKSDSSIGWEYRYTDGRFRYPTSTDINGLPFNRNYKEDTGKALLKYVIGSDVTIDASAGYLKRMYPQSTIGAFSGDVWRASLQWKVTAITQIALSGWRELRAYVESESNYFVAQGASIAPTWTPTERLSVAVIASYEDQHFVAANASVDASSLRHDSLRSALATITYMPRDPVKIALSLQHSIRDSNFSQFQFSDNLVTLDVTGVIWAR